MCRGSCLYRGAWQLAQRPVNRLVSELTAYKSPLSILLLGQDMNEVPSGTSWSSMERACACEAADQADTQHYKIPVKSHP
jgi:hypothetical protein